MANWIIGESKVNTKKTESKRKTAGRSRQAHTTAGYMAKYRRNKGTKRGFK